MGGGSPRRRYAGSLRAQGAAYAKAERSHEVSQLVAFLVLIADKGNPEEVPIQGLGVETQ